MQNFVHRFVSVCLTSEPSRIHGTREAAATNSPVAKRRDFERRRRDIVPGTRGRRESFYTLLHGQAGS